MAVKSQGAQANLNGHVVERMLIPLFEANNFKVVDFPVYQRAISSPVQLTNMPRVAVKNYPFNSIYNTNGKTEFVIIANNRRIRVESKYQSTPGSVDEKFPYMLLNAIFAYPEKEVILIVDGGGYKEGARNWLQQMINNDWQNFSSQGKQISLMTIAEFVSWFNHQNFDNPNESAVSN